MCMLWFCSWCSDSLTRSCDPRGHVWVLLIGACQVVQKRSSPPHPPVSGAPSKPTLCAFAPCGIWGRVAFLTHMCHNNDQTRNVCWHKIRKAALSHSSLYGSSHQHWCIDIRFQKSTPRKLNPRWPPSNCGKGWPFWAEPGLSLFHYHSAKVCWWPLRVLWKAGRT